MRWCALLLLLAVSYAAGAGGSLRCNGGLVSHGDFTVEVIEACGEPDFVDRWRQTVPNPHNSVPNIEQWYYNFGPSRLVQVLKFREGTLQRIDSAGYGFATPGPRRCGPTDIVAGISKYRLLQMCGEPEQSESLVVLSGRHRQGGSEFFRRDILVPVLREHWLYNFGTSRLLRDVTLENGVVVDIDTKGRGYESQQPGR